MQPDTPPPLLLDIHIPLLLLGPRILHFETAPTTVAEELLYRTRHQAFNEGPERHTERLKTLCEGLVDECGLSVLLWRDGDGAEGRDEERWRKEVGDGTWVLRATPPKDTRFRPVGLYDAWRRGDGLLTEKEAGLVAQHRVWAEPFTLQCSGLPVERWGEEVCRVLDAVRAISEFGKFGRRMTGVVCGEKGWARVAFRSSACWDEYVVGNTIVLLTAFERGLATLATPAFLCTFHPLTHFLTQRAIRKLRQERRALWKGFKRTKNGGKDDASNNEGGGRVSMKEQRQFRRMVERWVLGVAMEDERVEEKTRLLGKEGAAWWEEVWERIQNDEIGEVVLGIGKRTENEGAEDKRTGNKWAARLPVGLTLMDKPREKEEEVPSPALSTRGVADDDSVRSSDARTPNEGARLSSLFSSQAKPLPVPPVSSISFPIPLPSLSPTFPAYVSLLAKIIHFATSSPPATLHTFLSTSFKNSARVNETPLQELETLALKVGLGKSRTAILKEDVEPFLQDEVIEARPVDDPDPVWKVEKGVREVWEEGRRDVVMCYEQRANSENTSGYTGLPTGDEEVAADEVSERNHRPRVGYLERYEWAKGFMVPKGKRVMDLLDAREVKRKIEKMGEIGREDEEEGWEDTVVYKRLG